MSKSYRKWKQVVIIGTAAAIGLVGTLNHVNESDHSPTIEDDSKLERIVIQDDIELFELEGSFLQEIQSLDDYSTESPGDVFLPGIAYTGIQLVDPIAYMSAMGDIIPIGEKNYLSEFDQELMYRTAGFEIGNSVKDYDDLVATMRGVIEVINWRVNESCWPGDTIKDIVLNPGQFNVSSHHSFNDLWNGVINRDATDPVLRYRGERAAKAARQAVQDFMNGVKSPFEITPTNFDANGVQNGTFSYCPRGILNVVYGTKIVDGKPVQISNGPTQFYAVLGQ